MFHTDAVEVGLQHVNSSAEGGGRKVGGWQRLACQWQCSLRHVGRGCC